MRMALAPYPSYRWVAAFILVGLVLTPAVCIKDHAAASNRSPAIAQVGAKDRLKSTAVDVSSSRAAQSNEPRIVAAYGRLPLSFELNQGQTDTRA